MNKHAEYQLGTYMCDCVLSPCVYSNMHINLYICVYAYVYIYITHTHTHTHTHIYIYISFTVYNRENTSKNDITIAN